MTEDLDHLINTLKKYYNVKVDTEGKELVKIELDWDYKNRKVHLSMKPYLDKSLRQFNNVVPMKRQHFLYPHVKPKYGAKQQFVEYDESEPAGDNEKKHIQKVNGKFIWCSRGVDGTILTSVQLQQNNQTQPFIQCNKANSFWTIWPRKNQQFSHIAKVKWCWRSTATPATSMKRKPEAEPVAITSYQRMYLSPQIMVQFTMSLKS